MLDILGKLHCLGIESGLTVLTRSLLWVPVHSHCLSSQVTCPYVGCGESFADHSSIHAQVGVVAGEPRAQPLPTASWLHLPTLGLGD